jgi:hypothetical protein
MKKIGFVILAVILALGLTGAAYAYWTQNIYVNAAVETGTVQASFINAQSNPIFVDEGTTGGVAWYTDALGMYSTPNDTLNVTLSNAYPGMTAVLPVTIENTGTIPIGNIAIGADDLSNLPAGSTVMLTGTELSTGLAVGASTTNAVITVMVPTSADNSSFVQGTTASYGFTLTITSTQFAPGTQFITTGDTGVAGISGAPKGY